ncbi:MULTISPECIES: hypothetical protein [Tepidanaerobacter]|uniref:Uncharacterized protein n=1 Tax=Tepidanaerobacter syntrophicus TaxID=224999 RepID=A0A0U9HI82_9FIRM|nr:MULTISPECIES: hypothetical protein [Tepidanaerobacter]GAQ25588.1 hypothetical protein TSYNT_8117 [Tepidanaerobacter syntrophicus]GLI19959.1 hypothetical protein TSYNTROPHJE_17720 [Tepidanaerobacter syntrophicus]GLI51588.1 hypothetical protein TSYNTROOL_16740 [Tepidanaerobacter syntrophicus]
MLYNDNSALLINEEEKEQEVVLDVLEDYMLDYLYKSGYMEY